MNFIVEFYKSLDTINLIIFWGVIIVILLLLIFSIIIANKNKKLNQIINSRNKELKEKEQNFEDIPIKKEDVLIEKEKKQVENKENKEEIKENNKKEEMVKTIEAEKHFIAEEHVMEYNKNLFSLSNIKKTNEQHEESKQEGVLKTTKKEIVMPTAPYQKNVLREMSLNQTSPIGIVKQKNIQEKEINKAKELQELLKEEPIYDAIDEKRKEESKERYETPKKIENSNTHEHKTDTIKKEQHYENRYSEKIITNKPVKELNQEPRPKLQQEEIYKVESYIEKIEPTIDITKKVSKEKSEKEKYIEEVSKKLSESSQLDNIDRTEYEIKQEEEAIISYEELMQKKDSIKMIDEEEAVISIEELMERKNKEEKLYNLTEEEENDKFIRELKNFRSDL